MGSLPEKAAVSVDDDLAARESRVSLRSADDELARRIHEILRIRRQKLCRDDDLDDLLDHVLADRFQIDFRIMLRRNDDGIDGDGLPILVTHGHLRLAVGAQIAEFTALSDLCEAARQTMRESALSTPSAMSADCSSSDTRMPPVAASKPYFARV